MFFVFCSFLDCNFYSFHNNQHIASLHGDLGDEVGIGPINVDLYEQMPCNVLVHLLIKAPDMLLQVQPDSQCVGHPLVKADVVRH